MERGNGTGRGAAEVKPPVRRVGSPVGRVGARQGGLRVPGSPLPLLAALLLGGCFGYRPVDPVGVVPGDELRVELTRQAAAEFPEGAFPLGGSTLRGRLTGVQEGDFVLRVPVGETMQGTFARTLGQDLTISPGVVVQMYRRQFEPVRTVLAVAGGVGLVAVMVAVFGDVDNEPDPDPPLPPPEGFRIPLFSIPVR